MSFPDDLLCLFNARVEKRDGAYVIEIPEREVAIGGVEENEVHRVAVLSGGAKTTSTEEPRSAPGPERDGPEPPVEEGEVVDVEIEDIGEQGDGIARVGPGYVVIVPETEMGERVAVRISNVRENMAFADVVERHDPR